MNPDRIAADRDPHSALVQEKIAELKGLIPDEEEFNPEGAEERGAELKMTLAKQIANILLEFKSEGLPATTAQAFLTQSIKLAETEGIVDVGSDVLFNMRHQGVPDDLIDYKNTEKISVAGFERVRDELGRIIPDWEALSHQFSRIDSIDAGFEVTRLQEFFELMGNVQKTDDTEEGERIITKKIVPLCYQIFDSARTRSVAHANHKYQYLEENLPERNPRECEDKTVELKKQAAKIHDLESARTLPLTDPVARFVYDQLVHHGQILDRFSTAFQTEGKKSHA